MYNIYMIDIQSDTEENLYIIINLILIMGHSPMAALIRHRLEAMMLIQMRAIIMLIHSRTIIRIMITMLSSMISQITIILSNIISQTILEIMAVMFHHREMVLTSQMEKCHSIKQQRELLLLR